MSKYTTTIYEIIKSELIKSGKNEFFNNNQLTFFNDEFSFIKKIMAYDKDVQKIVTKTFFQNVVYTNSAFDLWFKKAFVNRFLNNEIGRQTVEDFSSQLMYCLGIYEKYMIFAFENYQDILSGKGITIHENRLATQTLPQNEVNIDLNDDLFEFADTNNISKDTNDSTKYSLDDLIKSFNIFERIFDAFDEKCFLQVW